MSRPIIAFNWKSNPTALRAQSLLNTLSSFEANRMNHLIVIPPTIYLEKIHSELLNKKIHIGAQDVSANPSGAFTGDISAEMLHSIGVSYTLVGHSERRYIHKEKADILNSKIKQLLEQNITPIICVGEPLSERENKNHIPFIENQLNEIFNCLPKNNHSIIIAYEPIWSIGTGKTATSKDIAEMAIFIEEYKRNKKIKAPILYGGSVQASIVSSILNIPHINGVLVGGSSLKKEEVLSLSLA